MSEYEAGLAAAGLADLSVTFGHQVADGMQAAIVRVRKLLEANASAQFAEYYDRISRYVLSLRVTKLDPVCGVFDRRMSELARFSWQPSR